MNNILIVDDEDKIRELINMNLELAGYKCYQAKNDKEAIEYLRKVPLDLALLDIMLHGKDGYEIAKDFIRNDIPVIFLTAKDNVVDRVKGLRMGADDYIIKPFETIELLARIENVLRRSLKVNDVFKYRDIAVDLNERTVKKDDGDIELTNQEYQLLETLIKNKNLALSREKLLESAWGYDFCGDTRTVDIHIQRLRKKLDWEDVIVTVYKYGYRMEIKNEDSD